MANLRVPAFVKPQTDKIVAAHPLTTLAEHTQTADTIPQKSRMRQQPSHQSSCHLRLSGRKPKSHKWIAFLLPDRLPTSSAIKLSQLVKPNTVCLYIVPP
jgi:hypothetical protein